MSMWLAENNELLQTRGHTFLVGYTSSQERRTSGRRLVSREAGDIKLESA